MAVRKSWRTQPHYNITNEAWLLRKLDDRDLSRTAKICSWPFKKRTDGKKETKIAYPAPFLEWGASFGDKDLIEQLEY